ncbi:MAG: 3-hydroxybutyryl-CoA dehydrogenase [Myxococcales bacterium]|nr:3-hydroxybutyryl-CoA dehydrogenase [Myxococcales bacterium]
MSIRVVGVVGAGQMGAGIAQVAAASGCDVRLADSGMDRASAGKAGIEKRLARAVSKGRMTETEATAIAARITPVGALSDMAGAQLVVEAVTENESLKDAIFAELDTILGPDAILASNTSSIPITRMGAKTSRPDKFIGMHFMNPVPIMKLVEVIRGLATSDDTYAAVAALAEKMGKITVLARDMPGFVVNRILMPMINEAVVTLYHGIGSVEDIDQAMKLGTNQPMGPLTLADFIGLDTCLAIMNVLHEGTGDTKYRPCPLLRQYVDAGWLGRKSGRGFYDYSEA